MDPKIFILVLVGMLLLGKLAGKLLHRSRSLQELQDANRELSLFLKAMMVIPPNELAAIDVLSDRIHAWAKAKGFWDQPRNDGEMLMLVVSELAEGLEYLRSSDPRAMSDHIDGFLGIEEELADATIRIFDLAKGRNWRLADAIKAKMDFNNTRPYKHGKKF